MKIPVLALALLLGVLAAAHGQTPRKIMRQAPPVRITFQAPPVRGHCHCGGDAGLCSCTACECPVCAANVRQPRTKKADDGGPDWYAGADGYWYRPAPQPAPVYYQPAYQGPANWPPAAYGGFGAYRGGSRGGC